MFWLSDAANAEGLAKGYSVGLSPNIIIIGFQKNVNQEQREESIYEKDIIHPVYCIATIAFSMSACADVGTESSNAVSSTVTSPGYTFLRTL